MVFNSAFANVPTNCAVCTVYASYYSRGGNEPLTLFPAATHAPINETSIRHRTEAQLHPRLHLLAISFISPTSDKSVQAVGTTRLILLTTPCLPALSHPLIPSMPVYISYWSLLRVALMLPPPLERRRVGEATRPKHLVNTSAVCLTCSFLLCRYFKSVQPKEELYS